MKKKDASETLKHLLSKAKPSRRVTRTERCSECDGIIKRSRARFGSGYCEACSISMPVAIGRIVSKGPHQGKYIYLKSAILQEIREGNADPRDISAEVDEELRNRDFFVIELYEED